MRSFKVKNKFKISVILAFIILFTMSVTTFADDVNGQGQEGSSGTSKDQDNVWHEGCGWRVYVADKEGRIIIQPKDIYLPQSGPKKSGTGDILWVGNTKLTHNQNYKLLNGYDAEDKIHVPVPGSSHATLEYFWTNHNYNNIKGMIEEIGWEKSFEEIKEQLEVGEWFIVMEPVMYLRFQGANIAITATEAALLNKYVFHGDLCRDMGSATHNILPGWAYLEETQWRIPPGERFNTNGRIFQLQDDVMISTYGIISISMKGLAEDPTAEPFDYEFHTDTDVIVSLKVSSGSEINPDDPGRATFHFPDRTIAKEYVMPSNSDQLVWVSWHTPEEPGNINVNVDLKDGDSVDLNIKLTPLEENTPPDPQGRDTSAGFSVPNLPTPDGTTSLEWGEWRAEWVPDLVWEPGSSWTDSNGKTHHDKGEYVDYGEWEFEEEKFSAELIVDRVRIFPDERAKTASGQNMKSGYGLNTEVIVQVVSNCGTPGGGNYTDVQNIVATFPEFDYEFFNRHLERSGNLWEFQENEYSQFKNAVHFTPVWYPDNSNYVVSYEILDCWTPAGQLTCVANSDEIHIDSNVFSDWHTAPSFAH